MKPLSDNRLKTQIAEAEKLVPYFNIYSRLCDVAAGLLEDERYTREDAAKAILEVMDYVRDFTQN